MLVIKHQIYMTNWALVHSPYMWFVWLSLRPSVDFDMRLLVRLLSLPLSTPSLLLSHHWALHKLDVKNALLYGILHEILYCEHPSGILDHFMLITSGIYKYCLKQAPCT